MLTMRFLASGDLQVSLYYSIRMAKSVSRIASETSEAIVQAFLQDYISPPETEERWKNIAQEFRDLWRFTHVVAVDGKYVVIEAPVK